MRMQTRQAWTLPHSWHSRSSRKPVSLRPGVKSKAKGKRTTATRHVAPFMLIAVQQFIAVKAVKAVMQARPHSYFEFGREAAVPDRGCGCVQEEGDQALQEDEDDEYDREDDDYYQGEHFDDDEEYGQDDDDGENEAYF